MKELRDDALRQVKGNDGEGREVEKTRKGSDGSVEVKGVDGERREI